MTEILFFCSPIGLGHATRDLAIINQLDVKSCEVYSGSSAIEFFQMNDVINRVKQGENPPICKEFEGQSCNGLIKPTAVFFGEGLPKSPWDSAVDKSKDTSLMIVIGSSLQVSPANSLPDVALRTGSELVIIDLMDTPFDSRATLKITDRAVHVATLLEESLGL